MKLSDYVRVLFLQAAMNPTLPKPSVEKPDRPPVAGLAPDELRKPLLIGRRGKGTRKQRRERRR